MPEIEKSRDEIVSTWMGEGVVKGIKSSANFFKRLGGYPLLPKERKVQD